MYAGFWKRFLAFVIDYVISFNGLFLIVLLTGLLLAVLEPVIGEDAVELVAGWIAVPVFFGSSWLYSALFESSRLQATPGKLALGLIVADERNGRISFGRATARHFGKAISVVVLFIGFIMAAFTPRKQALHDMICGTLVLKKDELRRYELSRSAADA